MKRTLGQVVATGIVAGCGLVTFTASSGCFHRVAAAALDERSLLPGPLQAATSASPATDKGPSGTETVEIAGLQVSVWRPATTSAAPLVVFSHGFRGSSTQSTFLMKALADDGYIVVAPNHKDSSRITPGGAAALRPAMPFERAADWSDKTYKDRADDIVSLLAAMKKDPIWAKKVDWSKVALAGHSLGGYTVLGLAGAWRSWKLPEVKAVLALSPYCTPYIQKGSLGAIEVPVMYQGGTRDFGITPFVKKPNGAYDLTNSPKYFVEFNQAGHLAWTDLNPRFQSSVDYYSIAFLDKYVRGSTTANPTVHRADVSDLRSK